MTISLYNSLSRSLEPLEPVAPPRVTIYHCGPTVWNYAHIGNFRTFLFGDLLRRHLEYRGLDVFVIMNLTDVDDRTIQAAARQEQMLADYTRPFVEAFFEDRDYLRIKPAHVYPRATEHIPAMIDLVERLLARGVAYTADDGSVYFGVDRFPTYGRLSRIETRELKSGARVASDEYSKDDPRDFALWKAVSQQDEEVGAAWDAGFGRGRPGWHLECSAMSLSEVRRRFEVETLDIHTGGVDLIFPHHEDEIAQSEAATQQPFAKCWMHGAFLQVGDGVKMSKRFGNVVTARDLRMDGWDGAAFRHLVFSTHYRQPLSFTDDGLQAAAQGIARLGEFDRRVTHPPGSGDVGAIDGLARMLEQEVGAALDDDLDAPRALAAVHTFVREANKALDGGASIGEAARDVWYRIVDVLDVLPEVREADADLSAWVEERIAARKAARDARDYATADAIRAELGERGVDIEDTPDGTRWKLS